MLDAAGMAAENDRIRWEDPRFSGVGMNIASAVANQSGFCRTECERSAGWGVRDRVGRRLFAGTGCRKSLQFTEIFSPLVSLSHPVEEGIATNAF